VIGTEVQCTDGVCGAVTRVVVDPVARAVTHLVVATKHGYDQARLVPLDRLQTGDAALRLDCTVAELDHFERADEQRFLPGADDYADYSGLEALSWPYYGLGMGIGGGIGFRAESTPVPLTVDLVPDGEVEIRRGDRVHATDGAIGHVHGFAVDRADRRITHVLLEEGHLWGHKEVAIPIGDVVAVDDGIRLRLAKHDVQRLPPVDLERPDRTEHRDRAAGRARVLIATDGSQPSLDAARAAAALFGPDAEFVLLCVKPDQDVSGEYAGGFEGPILSTEEAENLNRAAEVAADASLAATASALGATPVEQRVEEGSPADTICRAARDLDADVVVVGSHGKGAVAAAVMGSVSRSVVHHCHRPVLVVPPRA
jgi:nucleotide-binding universal stress UspA family protein